jgi:hypothetical protein
LFLLLFLLLLLLLFIFCFYLVRFGENENELKEENCDFERARFTDTFAPVVWRRWGCQQTQKFNCQDKP